MFFANPWLFWGLAATVAAPIVLHLIMRQSPKHFMFPALRFLQQRKDANRRRLRFRHLLLLALRIAALLFLAMALCRPSVGCSGIRRSQEGPVSAAIVIDTTPSMDYEHGTEKRLQVAKDIAAWLLTKLPEGSEVALGSCGPDRPNIVVDFLQAKQDLSQLDISMAPRRFLDVAAEAIDLLQNGKHEAKELYLFTDLSRGEWSEERSARLTKRLAELPNLSVYIIDVGVANPQNTALGELQLSDQTAVKGTSLQLRQVVQRTGEPFTSQLRLVIRDDAGLIVLDRFQKIALNANGSLTALFDNLPKFKKPGSYQGEIRIVNRENNLLEVDDKRYFSFDVKPRWPIVLAAPGPQPRAYTWDLERFLRTRFNCTVVTLKDLAQELPKHDAVCLLDPGKLEPPLWEKLSEYAKSGGSVAFFLGRNAEADMESFNEEAAQKLLAGKLLEILDASDSVSLNLKLPGDPHPIVSYFLGLDEPLRWDLFKVRRFWQLSKTMSDGNEPGVVIRYTNDKRALLSRKVGEGRTLTMTTPISEVRNDEAGNGLTPWNDLTFSVQGLPPRPLAALVNEMMLYLVGANEQPLNYIAGDDAKLRLDAGQRIEEYLLNSPKGSDEFRKADPEKTSITVTSLTEIGNYRVENKANQLNRGFSVNMAARESILDRVDENELKAILAGTPFSLARNRDEINRKLTETRVGYELFPLLIALVAIILAVEHVLANRFYQNDGEEGEQEGWREGGKEGGREVSSD